MSEPLIRLDGVSRVYGSGATEVRALDDVDLAIPAGQFVSLLGPSGSGKTTLLNVVGAIDHPTHGSILVDGVELVGLDRGELTAYRRDKVGFVFQFFNLVPTLTALENVELIASLTERGDAHQRSLDALASVGLAELLDRFPAQLSGGQQQRVAIARAIAKETPVLLCDEPTGALDRATGEEVLELLRAAVSDLGRTVIVVSHDPTVEHVSDRSLHLVDGRLVDDRLRDAASDDAGTRRAGDDGDERGRADDGGHSGGPDARGGRDDRADRVGRSGDSAPASGAGRAGRAGPDGPATGVSVDAGTGGS